MYNFNRLEVYRRADLFSDVVHGVTMAFSKFEKYALGDQMRRSADSVVANVEEGGSKESNTEILQYLRHAVGSASELEGWIKRAGSSWRLGRWPLKGLRRLQHSGGSSPTRQRTLSLATCIP